LEIYQKEYTYNARTPERQIRYFVHTGSLFVSHDSQTKQLVFP